MNYFCYISTEFCQYLIVTPQHNIFPLTRSAKFQIMSLINPFSQPTMRWHYRESNNTVSLILNIDQLTRAKFWVANSVEISQKFTSTSYCRNVEILKIKEQLNFHAFSILLRIETIFAHQIRDIWKCQPSFMFFNNDNLRNSGSSSPAYLRWKKKHSSNRYYFLNCT